MISALSSSAFARNFLVTFSRGLNTISIVKSSQSDVFNTARVNRASSKERALEYVSQATRVRLQDLKDNPGARTMGRQVSTAHNQAGHTIGEMQRAAKPPFGWIWGNFYRPWHKMFPGEKQFNGDINLRREYVPLSLLELQRIIDLGYLDTSKLIDVCALCATKLLHVQPDLRQYGIHLTDEGSEIFTAKINLEVQWASLTTIASIERAGGRIRTAYYDLNSLRAASTAELWFMSGNPIPARKYPPHSILNYYTNPNYRGYLSEETELNKSAKRLAKILKYDWQPSQSDQEQWKNEQKRPMEVFLGLKPGSVISLRDEKVFVPTHPTVVNFYNPPKPLADHLR